MRPLGIEFLSVFGLPPVEFVNLAGDLGCNTVSIALGPGPAPFQPAPYEPYSLTDRALRHEMLAAMRDRDVSVALGEGLIVQPGIDVADHAPALDLMVELGAPRINTISLDPDQPRTVDQISQLVEMAWERGMTTTVETSPGFLPGTLAEALEVIDAVGHPALGLLVDTMHIVRGGALPADVAAAADRIRYVQLSDAPMASRSDLSYFEEAMFERMAPGDGELPLRELLAVVPEGTVVSLEVPLRSEAAAGRGPHERLGRCVEATRALLDA